MEFEITRNKMILFGVIVGAVLGLIPLISGFIKKNPKFGVIGFVSSIIGGAILGIYLAIPLAAIFTWLTLKKPSANVSAVVTSDSDQTPAAETPSNSENS